MNVAVQIRMEDNLYREVEKRAKKELYSSVPDFIRQTLREKIKEESA